MKVEEYKRNIEGLKDYVLDAIINYATRDHNLFSEGTYRLLSTVLERFIDRQNIWEDVYEEYFEEAMNNIKGDKAS